MDTQREGQHGGGCRCDMGSQGRNYRATGCLQASLLSLKDFRPIPVKARGDFDTFFGVYFLLLFLFCYFTQMNTGKVRRECRRKETKPPEFSEFVCCPSEEQKHRRVLALCPQVPSSPWEPRALPCWSSLLQEHREGSAPGRNESSAPR